MKAAHAALREGTRAEHERLDALLGGFDLADRAQYTAFLAAHAEAVWPVEAMLDECAGLVVDDWAARRRGDALRADLVALSVAPSVAPSDAGATVIGQRDAAWAGGALYVLEGSRLGAKFLVRAVGDGLPRGYLGDEQPRGRWPALLAALDRVLADDAATDRAVTAAREVFARFEAATRRRQLDATACTGVQNG